ncbi:Vacuolar protein sorting-associated protein 29 [Rhizoclosmatium sp. JEL0117]|nr:Vacuolar protein sorting-associated protein 29 [Rhizoclosmatium sp. JEL0117]
MVLVLAIGDLHIPQRAADIPAKFKKLLVPGKMQHVLSTGNLCSRDVLSFLRSIAPNVTLVSGDCDDASLGGNGDSAVVQVGNVRIGLVHGHATIPWGDRAALASCARMLDVDVLVSGHTHRFEAFESEGRFYLNPGSATGALSSFTPLVRVPIPAPAAVENKENQEKKEGEKVVVEQEKEVAPEEEEEEEEEEEDNGGIDDDVHGGWGAPAKKTKKKAAVKQEQPKEKEEPSTAPVRTHKLVSDIIPSFALLDVQGNAVVVYVYKLIDGDVKVEKLEFTKKG